MVEHSALCFTHLIALNKLSISGNRYTTFMFFFTAFISILIMLKLVYVCLVYTSHTALSALPV